MPRVQREGAGGRHRAGRPRLEVLAGPRFGLAQLYLGHYRRTIEVRTPQLAALDAALVRECFQMPLLPAVSGRGYVSAAHAAMGDFAAAARATEEALRIASAADHPYSIVHA